MAPTPVLIVASNTAIAGGENYLLSCLKQMDRGRYHPIVWLPGDGAFRAALELVAVEYVIEPVDYGWLTPPRLWYAYLGGLSARVHRIVELIRSRGIRLVHTNSNMMLEGALAASIAGVPHLYLAHIEYQPDMPFFRRFPLDPASYARLMGDLSLGILAVSAQVRDGLSPPLPRERITVVNNGLEMERYDEALRGHDGGLRRSLDLPETAVLVVAAGRVIEDKGFDILLEAAARVAAFFPEAIFLICGPIESSAHHDALTRRVAELALKGRFRFLGRRSDLPEVLVQSDIFVLSSRREGHPYVLLEAMACNLPCIASNCGGVEETVREGETGFVIPIADVERLADRLSLLLGNAALRHQIGAEAGRHVRAHFTSTQTAQGLFAIYANLLSRQQVVAGAYAVDLLLRAAAEMSYLGSRLIDLEERMKKADRAAAILLDNPLMRALRWIKKRLVS